MNRTIILIVQLTAVFGLFELSGCANDPPANVGIAEFAEARDVWDIYFMQGKRIGYAHTQVSLKQDPESGRELLRCERLDHLAVKRDGQTTEQDIRTISMETLQGQMIRFESEMRMGKSPIRTIGRVRGSRLVMETTVAEAATPTKTSIPWSPETLGPMATELTLLGKPMKPGERRTFKTLMIGMNQAAEVEMTAKNYEPTVMSSGTYDLLRIDTMTRLPGGQMITGSIWTDRTGETLKTSSEALGLESFRATKAEALDKANAAELDLLSGTIVKVERPLSHAQRTKQVRYRVHLDGSDPAGVFTTGPSQAVKSIDPHTAEVTVYAIRPGEKNGNPNAPKDPPNDADLQPNDFVQSEDPAIVADAKEAASGETDRWRIVKALEGYVHRKVKNKNYTQAFASAAEVAKSLEGDCTEHAVYLTALARALGIPARAAIGLVYMEREQAFGYHMWTEVYVDGRWIPIDGTLAQGGIGADHLKIGQTNLQGASAYSAFLPVVEILGQLRIEVIDVPM